MCLHTDKDWYKGHPDLSFKQSGMRRSNVLKNGASKLQHKQHSTIKESFAFQLVLN
jgi:hypothetical protein